MREDTNFEGTGFKQAVYGETSMPKETVGTRVPVAIAEQVDRYAETHDLSRTGVMELFIRTALENPDASDEKRVYTGRIRAEWHPSPPHCDPRGRPKRGDGIEQRVKRKLAGETPYVGEFEENEALTARLPGDLVRDIEEWGESHDMNKSNAAADLLVRGLKADPLPDDHTVELEGESYTLELEPELADVFRRWRLSRRQSPSEAVSTLLQASESRKSIRPDWGKPDEE